MLWFDEKSTSNLPILESRKIIVYTYDLEYHLGSNVEFGRKVRFWMIFVEVFQIKVESSVYEKKIGVAWRISKFWCHTLYNAVVHSSLELGIWSTYWS